MYHKGYGIIQTWGPLHVGATAGEESSNLNLIFRDQFTQTGIVPGSSIRGRLRADMLSRLRWQLKDDKKAEEQVNNWYGRGAEKDRQENYNYESIVKIEHASLVWLPVFCPGQPIVWVSCPYLLKRYKRIAGIKKKVPRPYTSSSILKAYCSQKTGDKTLFFNLGFIKLRNSEEDWKCWFPNNKEKSAVVVDDAEIGIIHDMALYRQSRVALDTKQKVVKEFFNVEALPEETILAFPFGLKPSETQTWENWEALDEGKCGDVYLGGLESVGFGHCYLTLHQRNEEVNQ
jgi:CRISPR-associated protein Cmr4